VAASYNSFVPARDQRPLTDVISRSYVAPRFQSYLVSAFAAVATLLAAVGLIGSLGHSVVRRRRELGVRIAVGATRRDLLVMVLRNGMTIAGTGLLVGTVTARFAARALGGLLYDLAPTDVETALASVPVLAAVSAGACLVPGYRASTVDPTTSLEAQ